MNIYMPTNQIASCVREKERERDKVISRLF